MGLAADRGEFVRCKYGLDDDGSVCVDGADGGAVADTSGFSGPQTCKVVYVQSLELRNGYGCAKAVKEVLVLCSLQRERDSHVALSILKNVMSRIVQRSCDSLPIALQLDCRSLMSL